MPYSDNVSLYNHFDETKIKTKIMLLLFLAKIR